MHKMRKKKNNNSKNLINWTNNYLINSTDKRSTRKKEIDVKNESVERDEEVK